MDQIEQCPKCGSITEGIPVYEIKQQGVRTGARFATKKVLLYIATIIMGNVIFPVVGTFPGFIVAFLIAAYIERKADQVSDSFVQTTFDSTPFEFSCPHCGVTWNRIYEKGVDFTTDSVLEWQKDALVEEIRGNANSSRIIAIIAGIICAPCALYCLTHLSGQSDYLLWWLLFLIGFPALCLSINRGIKSHNLNEEADNLEYMSVSSFRHSDYRAGNPFVGVDKPLDKMDEVSHEQPRGITPKEIVSITQEPIKRLDAKSSELTRDNQDKIIGLFEAGIITSEEYAELEKREEERLQTETKPQSVIQVENNKIDLLKNLKSLLDSEILLPEEYRIQKNSILHLSSIPMWKDDKTKYETLIEVKSLLDTGVLTQEEFDSEKNKIINS